MEVKKALDSALDDIVIGDSRKGDAENLHRFSRGNGDSDSEGLTGKDEDDHEKKT